MNDFYEVMEALVKEAANPLSPEQLKAKKEEELKMFHAYKKNPAPETFRPLYNSFKPVIYKAALPNMKNSQIPQSAHLALAAQSFYDALKNYDPTKAGLSTFVSNYVTNKGKRLNYKYMNIGYIPEARITEYQPLQNAIHVLRERLDREPSSIELADELKIPLKKVEMLRKEIRRDLVMDEHVSEALHFAQSDRTMQMARDIQYNLIPQHQLVLEHTLGLNGRTPVATKKAGTVNIEALKKATGLSENIIRSAQKTISREIAKYRGTHDIGSMNEVTTDGTI